MKNNRRSFLQKLALGTGAVSVAIPGLSKSINEIAAITDENNNELKYADGQRFNMCGYAAPKMDKVRIGFIGLGMRGPSAVERISLIDGVEIVALCDKDPNRAAAQQKKLEKTGRPKAREYSGEDGWKALCESNDIDLVYTCTSLAFAYSYRSICHEQWKAFCNRSACSQNN